MALEARRAAVERQARSRLHTLAIDTRSRVEFKDITAELRKLVAESRVESGLCHLFVPHTSAGLLIQENDDPALQKDLEAFLKNLAPMDAAYHHNDGNCDAHLKAAVMGCSKTLLIDEGRLVLGRWQGVFLSEFDGPRRRQLHVKIVSA